MQKGKEHNANVNKINTEIEAFKTAADKRDLMKGGKKKQVMFFLMPTCKSLSLIFATWMTLHTLRGPLGLRCALCHTIHIMPRS
jgi:LSD1 subclass zinc finger protein